MAEVLFFLAAIVAIAGAIGVIALKNPFNSVLALVVHLIALAMLFLLLHSEFVAAAQVVVYAGAVMVLYVFVSAYVGDEGETWTSGSRLQRSLALLLAGALAAELLIALLGTGLRSLADADELPRLRPDLAAPRRSASCCSPATCWPSRPPQSSCSPLPLAPCSSLAADPAVCLRVRAWLP